MYVLRTVLRTGAALDFHFVDLGVAQRAIDAITEKRVERGQVRILDDAGRDFRFAAEDVLTEGLIDVELETASVVRLGVLINRAGAEIRAREGVEEQAAFHQPPPAGALGNLLPGGNTANKGLPRFSP